MAYNWYIVQAHSGFEKKVALAIAERAEKEKISDAFQEITVPTEAVVEMKKGRKVNTERKFFPGYILVKMHMSDKAWHLVKTIPKVTGFLGGQGKPQSIPENEIQRILRQVEEGIEKPINTALFETGQTVKINDGPFESFVGVVEEVDEDRGTLKISVSIFGRDTPVELGFSQVEKV